MNLRALILLSLAANVTVGALLWRRQHASITPSHAPAKVAVAPAEPAPVVPEKNAVTEVMEPFDWSRLASSDFKRYRDNLRAIACPEDTLRVILTSEIDSQFLRRRRALLDEYQRNFWEHLARREMTDDKFLNQPLRDLKAERDKLLVEVLGTEKPEPADEAAALARRHQRGETLYAWLPPEKRQQMIAAEEKAWEQKSALSKEIAARPDQKETEEDKRRREYFQDELMEARRRLLTAEEMAEYVRRNSKETNWARNLSGFETTEAEWRAGVKIMQDYNEALAKLGHNQQAKPVAEARDQQLQALFGADRFAQYQLASNEDYQMTRRIMARYQLPDSLAQEVAGIQKQTTDAAAAVMRDQTLDPEARKATLDALAAEARRALQQKLPGEVWQTYLKYHGNWLNK